MTVTVNDWTWIELQVTTPGRYAGQVSDNAAFRAVLALAAMDRDVMGRSRTAWVSTFRSTTAFHERSLIVRHSNAKGFRKPWGPHQSYPE